MDPWPLLKSIVGWVGLGLAGIIGLLIALAVLVPIIKVLRNYYLHLRTRNTPPASGQVWAGWDVQYRITHIFENGVLSVKWGNASMGESPDKWAQRVRSRRLYLHERD